MSDISKIRYKISRLKNSVLPDSISPHLLGSILEEMLDFSGSDVNSPDYNPDEGNEGYGVSFLKDLDDVSLSALMPGHALVYTGSKWTNQAISQNLDIDDIESYLSEHDYVKKSDIPSLAGYAMQSWVEGKGYALDSALTSHTGNAAIHITSEERTAWNAKLDESIYDTFKNGYDTWKDTVDGFIEKFDSMFVKEPDGKGGYRIKALLGFYGDKYISARGLNPFQAQGSVGLDETRLAQYLSEHSYARLSDIPSLDGYALKSEIPSLAGYATQSWVEGKGYITDAYTTGEADARFLGISANAASASKLSDNSAFKAWGQTFFEDGVPKSISGELTGVTSIKMSRYLFLNWDTSTGQYLKADDTGNLSINTHNNYLHTGNIAHFGYDGNVGIGKIADGYRLDVNGGIRASNTIISTSANAFRMVYGNYGALWRIDDYSTYLLLTNSGDQYGNWNSLRPFSVSNATGRVIMENGLWVNKITIGDCEITWDGTMLKFSKGIYSEGAVSARGKNNSGGGGSGVSYNRLDAWADYNSDRSGYVLSAGLGYDLYSKKLNLSGGTLTGDLYISRGDNTYNLLALGGSGGLRCLLHTGMVGGYRSAMLSCYDGATAKGSIGVKSDGTPYYLNSSSSVYTLWHSGNDGSGSGLDADLLDGREGSAYSYFAGNLTSLGSGSPADTTKNYFINSATANMVTTAYNTSGAEYAFIFSKASSGSYGSVLKWGYSDKYLRILRYQGSSWKSDDWEKIDAGNADTATRLQGSFSLWGQTFYGNNVSGSLTGVGDITSSNYYLRNNATNPYLRLTVSGQNYYCQATSSGISLGPTEALSLLVDKDGDVRIHGNLRIKNDDNYGCKLYFGDSGSDDYVYLYEDEDDHLTIHASNGIDLIDYVTINDSCQVNGTLYTRNIIASATGYNIGSNTTPYNNIYANGLYAKSNTDLYLGANNAYHIRITTAGALAPYNNGTQDLGLADRTWQTVYARNGIFTSETKYDYSDKKNLAHILNGAIELYNATPYIDFHFNNSSSDYDVRLINQSAGLLRCTGVFFANVGIYSDGYVSARGRNTSDVRLKTDIHEFCAMEIIKALKPVAFRWNALARSKFAVFDTNEVQYGLIAQETYKTAPWLVDRNMFGDGLWGVHYESLIPVLTQGVREVAFTVDDLLVRVKKLETDCSRLNKENKELKRKIKILERR